MKNLRQIKARNWAWAAVLVMATIWWPLYIITTPPEFLQQAVDPHILIVCMSVALLGGLLKTYGYLASQFSGKQGVVGISVELTGTILATVGPGSYLITSIYSFVQPGIQNNYNSAFIFACTLLAIYAYRASIIVPRFLNEAHDPTKDDA